MSRAGARACLIGAAAGALAMTGCSRGDDAGASPTTRPAVAATTSTTTPASTVPVTTTPTSTVPATTAPPAVLADACRGMAVLSSELTAPYDATPGLHPIEFVAVDDQVPLGAATDLPRGWGYDGSQPAQLVACVGLERAEPAEICSGYADAASGLEWSVRTHSATYALTVRQAGLADVVATETIELPAPACPLVSAYTQGEPTEVPLYPELTAGVLEPFVKPHVTGGASVPELLAASPTVPASELTGADFHQVCRGTGQPSATGTEGSLDAPGVVLVRTASEWGPASVTLPAERTAPSPGDAQLVVCLDMTAAQSHQICGGYVDATSGVEHEVETFDVTYSVTVRDARTAETLIADELLAVGDACPTFVTFGPGSGPQPHYPEPEPVAVAALFAPAAPPASSVPATSLPAPDTSVSG